MAKTIFITGTSSGLGRETALLFAKRGWNVLATMRTPAQETELQTVPRIRVFELDVTKPAQVTTTAAQALVLGPVDVVFNNAGYALAGPLEGSTDERLVREHPAYAAWWSKALSVYTAPARIAAMSAPEKIAEIVWEAATDYTDQLTYLAGDDAHALHAQRTAVGVDSCRAAMRAHFFGTDLP